MDALVATGFVTREPHPTDRRATLVRFTDRGTEVAGRLQPAGLREPTDTFAPSMTALVFLHVTLDEANQVPDRLIHRLSLKAAAAPPGQRKITETVGLTMTMSMVVEELRRR